MTTIVKKSKSKILELVELKNYKASYSSKFDNGLFEIDINKYFDIPEGDDFKPNFNLLKILFDESELDWIRKAIEHKADVEAKYFYIHYMYVLPSPFYIMINICYHCPKGNIIPRRAITLKHFRKNPNACIYGGEVSLIYKVSKKGKLVRRGMYAGEGDHGGFFPYAYPLYPKGDKFIIKKSVLRTIGPQYYGQTQVF